MRIRCGQSLRGFGYGLRAESARTGGGVAVIHALAGAATGFARGQFGFWGGSGAAKRFRLRPAGYAATGGAFGYGLRADLVVRGNRPPGGYRSARNPDHSIPARSASGRSQLARSSLWNWFR